ncbi:hypothetical protein, partial [Candidatus Thiosymbion oneisti]|uniref:hypothetical protein n=1 Tax=Candidatus Thiosymbion oneisti TaxID=589554 RepID=UPI001C401EE5
FPCIRMLDIGPMLSAARSFQVPTQRMGTRKTASGVTFYDTLPVGEGLLGPMEIFVSIRGFCFQYWE